MFGRGVLGGYLGFMIIDTDDRVILDFPLLDTLLIEIAIQNFQGMLQSNFCPCPLPQAIIPPPPIPHPHQNLPQDQFKGSAQCPTSGQFFDTISYVEKSIKVKWGNPHQE